MINLHTNEAQLQKAVERARERNIIIPTFEQQIDPGAIPAKIKSELQSIGLWEVHPRNLFRTTWKSRLAPLPWPDCAKWRTRTKSVETKRLS